VKKQPRFAKRLRKQAARSGRFPSFRQTGKRASTGKVGVCLFSANLSFFDVAVGKIWKDIVEMKIISDVMKVISSVIKNSRYVKKILLYVAKNVSLVKKTISCVIYLIRNDFHLKCSDECLSPCCAWCGECPYRQCFRLEDECSPVVAVQKLSACMVDMIAKCCDCAYRYLCGGACRTWGNQTVLDRNAAPVQCDQLQQRAQLLIDAAREYLGVIQE
jgi:hypothetical protein